MKNLGNLSSLFSLTHIVALATFGLIAILTFTLIIPKIKEINTNRALIPEKKEQLAFLQKKRGLLESVESVETQKLFETAEIALPQEKDAASILIALENIAAQTEMGVDDIELTPGIVSTQSARVATSSAIAKTSEGAKTNEAQSLSVDVATRGTTQQFVDFMNVIQNSRRIFDIQEVVMSYLPEEEDFLTANFVLLAYYAPRVEDLSSLETPLPEITPAEKQLISSLESYPVMSATLSEDVNQDVAVGKENLFSQ